ncbi:unnamed protein product, partial [marine sediment metagenome]
KTLYVKGQSSMGERENVGLAVRLRTLADQLAGREEKKGG